MEKYTEEEICAEYDMANAHYGKEYTGCSFEERILHLLTAYRDVMACKTPCHLLKGRILFAMNDMFRKDDAYLEEAVREYELAMKSEETRMPDAEIRKVRETADRLQRKKLRLEYEHKQMGQCNLFYQEVFSYMHNSQCLTDAGFDFHDSFVYSFEHHPREQTVRLEIYDTWLNAIASFLFEGVQEDPLEYRYERDYRWLGRAYCYPAYYDKKYIVFDLGGEFCIESQKITVLGIRFLSEIEKIAVHDLVCGKN